jgi:phospho-N-acetylmuramoyl-pentapeptide-transferase
MAELDVVSQVELLKVIFPGAVAFVFGVLLALPLSKFLYSLKMWKKKSVETAIDGGTASITASLHNDEERKTPRMGGILVWGSVLMTAIIFSYLSSIIPAFAWNSFDFLSRSQTWIPLGVLLIGGLFGLIDDYLVCRGGGNYKGGGLSLRIRLLFVGGIAALVGYWFFVKLQIVSVYVPFFGDFTLGWLLIPLFILMTIGIYSGGIIDGVDGLSGGVFGAIFTAYAVIALSHGQYDLAAFCTALVGALLAFLWFNIPPARFFCSETGTMALTTSLVVVAFMTGAIIPLFVIAFPLIVTSASSLVQILSKKYLKRKVFVVAPLHNHFQATGWSAAKVTMRYWVASLILAIAGVILALVG